MGVCRVLKDFYTDGLNPMGRLQIHMRVIGIHRVLGLSGKWWHQSWCKRDHALFYMQSTAKFKQWWDNKFFSRRVINSQGTEQWNLYLHEQSSLIQVISLGNCLGEQVPCNTGFEELASEGTTFLINKFKKYQCMKAHLGDLQICILSAS